MPMPSVTTRAQMEQASAEIRELSERFLYKTFTVPVLDRDEKSIAEGLSILGILTEEFRLAEMKRLAKVASLSQSYISSPALSELQFSDVFIPSERGGEGTLYRTIRYKVTFDYSPGSTGGW